MTLSPGSGERDAQIAAKPRRETFLLEAWNTDRRYPDDVRYRAYTTSRKKAEAFGRIPKIQFTDSGHGIVFSFEVVTSKKKPPVYGLSDYIREHIAVA